MNNTKKYYWIRLKTDFFDQDTIDFLMGQENGAKYVVIYQMLMLKTAQQGGVLATKTNEIMIPYDVKKIVRDTKYFDFDTVTIALELFKKLGLVYEEENNILKLIEVEKLVGSEGKWAGYKRESRKANKEIGHCPTNVQKTIGNCPIDIDIEKDIKNKNIDIRDKSIEKDKNIDINNNIHSSKSKKPKHKYGEYQNVLLTDEEYNKLHQDYPNANELITYLDEYIEMKGYKAKSHNLAIRKWVVDAVARDNKKKPQQQVTSNPFVKLLMEEKETK